MFPFIFFNEIKYPKYPLERLKFEKRGKHKMNLLNCPEFSFISTNTKFVFQLNKACKIFKMFIIIIKVRETSFIRDTTFLIYFQTIYVII